MSRRQCSGEQEFGSDSFLDIIANIVGILIILIVVAGVKVARQPAASIAEADSVELTELPVEDANPLYADTPDSVAGGIAAAIQSGESPTWSLEEPDLPPTAVADLKLEIERLTLSLEKKRESRQSKESELQELEAALQAMQIDAQERKRATARRLAEEDTLARSLFALRDANQRVDTTAASIQATLSSLTRRQGQAVNALSQVAVETRQLQEVLESVDSRKAGQDSIQHRMSPVGESASDDQMHFRLYGGRIAHVPLEPLLDRLKTQVFARMDVVRRFHRYEGIVGPVGGFRMQYVVQRNSASQLQALQYGQGVYRMSIAGWKILPAETLEAETVDAALRIGSRFRQILESTEPGTTITVWLYPDEFAEFRRIRELIHNLNLRVAGRPLPQGTPIAGGPNGNESVAQ